MIKLSFHLTFIVHHTNLLIARRPFISAAAFFKKRHCHPVRASATIQQSARELPHPAAVRLPLFNADDVNIRGHSAGSGLEDLTVERDLFGIGVFTGIPLKEAKVVARLEIDDDRHSLEVRVEPVHPDLTRLTVERDPDNALGASTLKELIGDRVERDTLLKLKHPAELFAGEDWPLLRRRPFTVGLCQLAERLTRLRIHRTGADKVFFIELRAAFKNERVQGSSKLVGGSIDRLDLA